MYPIIILFGKDNDENDIYDDYYGHVDNLNDIKKIIKKIFIDIFEQNYDKMKMLYYEDDNILTLERFCESQWKEPYQDSLFFNIKYFDYDNLQWNDYKIKEKKLQKIITKLTTKHFI